MLNQLLERATQIPIVNRARQNQTVSGCHKRMQGFVRLRFGNHFHFQRRKVVLLEGNKIDFRPEIGQYLAT